MLEESAVNSQPQKPNKEFSKYFSGAFEFIKIIAIAVVIVLPVRYFLFQPFIVKGESMVPNFHSGDYLIVNEISYRFKGPERGDVVVLKFPRDTTQRFIKRIVGLPGETIKVENGKVWISKNGNQFTALEEKYLSGVTTSGNVQFTLQENQYVVLGDNRPYSYDSRGWGVLPKEDIVGKASLRLWPINHFSLIAQPTY